MKIPILLLASLILSACQSMHSNDPSQLSFRVPAGSTLSLNKAVEIPAGKTHVYVQSGRVGAESDGNLYDLGCRLNFKAFGPRTVNPEVFNIVRTADREGWESRPNIYFYSTEVFLASEKNTDVISMLCRTWAVPPSFNFSYADMEQTLGNYFTFAFNFPAPAKQ